MSKYTVTTVVTFRDEKAANKHLQAFHNLSSDDFTSVTITTQGFHRSIPLDVEAYQSKVAQPEPVVMRAAGGYSLPGGIHISKDVVAAIINAERAGGKS